MSELWWFVLIPVVVLIGAVWVLWDTDPGAGPFG